VPDELINKILQAAQWAPSGGNTQRWGVVVVREPWDQEVGAGLSQAPIRRDDRATLRIERTAARLRPRPLPAPKLRSNISLTITTEAPVRIVVCLADGEKPDRTAGSSIYLAVQNMLLATRARSRHDPDDRLSKTDL